MITTYAVSFATKGRTEADRITLIDLVTDWQMANYSVGSDDDDHRPGLSVRSRLASNDPVFRVTITDAPTKATHVLTTSVTIALLEGTLTFDLRIVSSPRTVKVAPHRPPQVPLHVVALVRDVLKAVPTFDAERRICDEVTVVDTTLKAQEIAYLVRADSRNLPVVVEVASSFTAPSKPHLAIGLGPLAGLVHMAHITTREALEEYSAIVGLPLAGNGWIITHWTGHSEPTIERTNEISGHDLNRAKRRVVDQVFEAAARSVAPHRVPPPPRNDADDLVEATVRESTAQGDEDSAAHIEQLESMVNELQGALESADRIIDEQRSVIERRSDMVDKLVLRNLSLEALAGTTPEIATVTTMAEALELARNKFEFLVFHERAIESAMKLQGPNPTAILNDLWRLNGVARRWAAGELNGASLKIACTEAGLNYAPGISATSLQKYEEDYLIDWRGRTVVAEAHLRRGRNAHLVRIHVYFDAETQQCVVAYIGRHLRGKHSPN